MSDKAKRKRNKGMGGDYISSEKAAKKYGIAVEALSLLMKIKGFIAYDYKGKKYWLNKDVNRACSPSSRLAPDFVIAKHYNRKPDTIRKTAAINGIGYVTEKDKCTGSKMRFYRTLAFRRIYIGNDSVCATDGCNGKAEHPFRGNKICIDCFLPDISITDKDRERAAYSGAGNISSIDEKWHGVGGVVMAEMNRQLDKKMKEIGMKVGRRVRPNA